MHMATFSMNAVFTYTHTTLPTVKKYVKLNAVSDNKLNLMNQMKFK